MDNGYEIKICKTCGKEFYRRKKSTGRSIKISKNGLRYRGSKCVTCSSQCSRANIKQHQREKSKDCYHERKRKDSAREKVKTKRH